MFQGTNQIAANYVSDNKDLSDLAFFQYPEINPAYGQSYMDAPMDGFVLPAKAQNKAAAKTVLEYIGSGPAESAYLKYDEWDVGLVTGLQVPTYNQVQKTSVQMISGQKAVSQFGDRDTDPAMAGRRRDGDPAVHRQPDRLDHQVDPEQPRGAGEDHLLIVSAQPIRRAGDAATSPARRAPPAVPRGPPDRHRDDRGTGARRPGVHLGPRAHLGRPVLLPVERRGRGAAAILPSHRVHPRQRLRLRRAELRPGGDGLPAVLARGRAQCHLAAGLHLPRRPGRHALRGDHRQRHPRQSRSTRRSCSCRSCCRWR